MLTAAAQANLLVTALLVYATATTLRAGIFSVAPAGFAAIGGYSVAILTTKSHWTFLPSAAVGVLCALVVSVVIALPILRLTGVYAALATLAFLVVLGSVVTTLKVTGGSLGLYGIPAADVRPALWVALAANVAVWYWVDHSSWGRRIDVTCESPVLAASMGINVPAVRLGAMAYSALLGAIAGSLYAHTFYVISPTVFAFSLAISVAALTVIAGSGHWLTPLISTFTVGVIPLAFQGLNNWGLIIQGALMTIVVVVYPDGLAGLARRLVMPPRATLTAAPVRPAFRWLAWL